MATQATALKQGLDSNSMAVLCLDIHHRQELAQTLYWEYVGKGNHIEAARVNAEASAYVWVLWEIAILEEIQREQGG